MKYILKLLKRYHKEYFHTPATLVILLFLIVAITINAFLDIEDHYIDEVWRGHHIRILWYILLFSIPYYFSIWVLIRFRLISKSSLRTGFWSYTSLIILLMAVDSSFTWHWEWIRATAPAKLAYWLYRSSNNLIALFTIILPLLVWYFYQKDRNYFYGLTKGSSHWQGYLFMLLMAAPLVTIASFTEGFQEAYPRYTPHYPSFIPDWVKIAGYELSYAFGFVSVELIFRGFLVIGLVRFLGPHAILPMAALYCVYHFGKPPLEAFSSIFGGYILGVLAYYSRSIIGGILIHVGLAWMMELAAWLQRLL